MNVKLSLIIPIYNAESFMLDTLVRLTEWKLKSNYAIQIILDNDGSKDITAKIVKGYINKQKSSFKFIFPNKHGKINQKSKFNNEL